MTVDSKNEFDNFMQTLEDASGNAVKENTADKAQVPEVRPFSPSERKQISEEVKRTKMQKDETKE